MDNKGKQIDTQAIQDILSRDNTAEVKRNKDGDVVILEVRKKIVKPRIRENGRTS